MIVNYSTYVMGTRTYISEKVLMFCTIADMSHISGRKTTNSLHQVIKNQRIYQPKILFKVIIQYLKITAE